MILDNEEQRNNLLEVVRNVPITGKMEEAIEMINVLKNLEHSLQAATIANPVATLGVVEDKKDE